MAKAVVAWAEGKDPVIGGRLTRGSRLSRIYGRGVGKLHLIRWAISQAREPERAVLIESSL